MISLLFLTVISFEAVDGAMLSIWFALILITAAAKFLSYRYFDPNFDAHSLTKFENTHHLMQAFSGIAWGSSCFFLLKSGDLNGNESLVLNMLCVLVAYSCLLYTSRCV